MPAHQLAVGGADFLQRRQIFLLVEHVPGQPHDVLGFAFGLFQDGNYIQERLAELAGEVAPPPFALGLPADLAGDEPQRAARRDAVGEALRPRPAGRLKDPQSAHLCIPFSLNRCSLPVSVRGSVSVNSTRRGYLYGAMALLTC